VKVEVIGLGRQVNSTTSSLSDAVAGNSGSAVNNTPQACWDVKVGGVLASGGGLDS